MKIDRLEIDLDELVAFTCLGLYKGFPTGGKYLPYHRSLCDKCFVFQQGHWVLCDKYRVVPGSDYSWGWTEVFVEEIPCLVINYGGRYKKEAIPCLKTALAAQLSAGIFTAGRGPRTLKVGDFLYKNKANGEISEFDAYEEIFNLSTGLSCGFHRVHGGIFMPNK